MLQPAQVDINREHWPFYCGVNRLCTKTISTFVLDEEDCVRYRRLFFFFLSCHFLLFCSVHHYYEVGLLSSRVSGAFNRPFVSLSCLGWL